MTFEQMRELKPGDRVMRVGTIITNDGSVVKVEWPSTLGPYEWEYLYGYAPFTKIADPQPSPLTALERELLAALRVAHDGTCDEVCEANSSNGLHSSQCYAKTEENFRTRTALLKRFEGVGEVKP